MAASSACGASRATLRLENVPLDNIAEWWRLVGHHMNTLAFLLLSLVLLLSLSLLRGGVVARAENTK